MAVLTVQETSRAGLNLSGAVAAAGGGDSFANTGVELLYISNAGVGAITLTLDIQQSVDGQAVTDRTVSIASGARQIVGPFPSAVYNDANSRMNVGYSGVVSVTVMAFKAGA